MQKETKIMLRNKFFLKWRRRCIYNIGREGIPNWYNSRWKEIFAEIGAGERNGKFKWMASCIIVIWKLKKVIMSYSNTILNNIEA